MTADLETRLTEYRQLLEQVGSEFEYGSAFVKAVLLAITLNSVASSRNDYIKSMGRHFGIDETKVNRIVELLPL